MLGVLSHTRVLRLAGLFTWVMVGLPLAYSQFENLHSRGDMGGWAILLFVAYLSFGTAYYWLTPSAETVSNSSRPRSSQLVWLSLRRMRVNQ